MVPRKPALPPRGLPLDDRELYEQERSVPLLLGSLVARVVERATSEAERSRALAAYSVARDATRVLLGNADDWQANAVARMAKERGVEPPLPSRDVEIIGGIVEDHARRVLRAPEEGKAAPVLAMLDALRAFDLPLLGRLREPAEVDALIAILVRVRQTDEADGRKVRTKRSGAEGARSYAGPDSRTLGSATVEILIRAGGLPKLVGEPRTSPARKRTVEHFDRKLRRSRKVTSD